MSVAGPGSQVLPHGADPNLLADMAPDRARQLIIAILKMQAAMKAQVEQEMMRRRAMQSQVEKTMLKERMMNKTSAQNWYKLASGALEEGIKEAGVETAAAGSARALQELLGQLKMDVAHGGMLGSAIGGLGGLARGAFTDPGEGEGRSKHVLKNLLRGGTIGGATGMAGGGLKTLMQQGGPGLRRMADTGSGIYG